MERISTSSAEELSALIDLDDFDPDEKDKHHGLQTFLMRLCHVDLDPASELDIVTQLDLKNPDYNVQDSHGRTALMHACIARKLSLVQFVTSRCSELTSRDNEGNNVLVYAIRSEDWQIVEHILCCDLPTCELLGARNNLGLTALDFAKRINSEYIIQLLEDHMPAHPAVKHLRKKQDKRQPRLPPAAFPTASKPLLQRPKLMRRVPFCHSKSLDIGDHVTPCDSDFTNRFLSQCVSDTDISLQDDDDVTPRDNDVTPRAEHHSDVKESPRSSLPPISSKSADQARGIDRRKCRRDSVSLPDLRDLSRTLVSGTTTPASQTGSHLASQVSLAGSEDVFEDDPPCDKNSSVETLPSLVPNKPQRGVPALSRTRKKSNSVEDVLHRSVVF